MPNVRHEYRRTQGARWGYTLLLARKYFKYFLTIFFIQLYFHLYDGHHQFLEILDPLLVNVQYDDQECKMNAEFMSYRSVRYWSET